MSLENQYIILVTKFEHTVPYMNIHLMMGFLELVHGTGMVTGDFISVVRFVLTLQVKANTATAKDYSKSR